MARDFVTGLLPDGPAPAGQESTTCDPSRTPWQPIVTAPRDTRTVLLIAAYPFGGTVWSDPRAGWWDGSAWTRWPHDFAPDFWAPITMPDASQGIEVRRTETRSGSACESPVGEADAPVSLPDTPPLRLVAEDQSQEQEEV